MRNSVISRLGLAALVAAGLCAARSTRAASPGLWFELTRTPEAKACPDASRLSQTVEALFDPSVVHVAPSRKQASLQVAISIEKVDGGYAALLRVESEAWSARRIVDADAECRGLPEALAVALVLLVEPDARAQQRRKPPNSAAGAVAGPPARAQRAIHLSGEGGGLLGTGLLGDLGSPTWAGFLGATITRGVAGLRLRGLRLLRAERTFGEGSLEFDAWAVLFGPCLRLGLPRGLAILPCAELGLGVQRGQARNFGGNDRDSAPWRVAVLEATLVVPLSGWARATGSAGGAFRLHRQNYFIDDQAAESQPAFAPFIGLGLELGGKIDDGE